VDLRLGCNKFICGIFDKFVTEVVDLRRGCKIFICGSFFGFVDVFLRFGFNIFNWASLNGICIFDIEFFLKLKFIDVVFLVGDFVLLFCVIKFLFDFSFILVSFLLDFNSTIHSLQSHLPF